jgi:hypothetical protein
MTKLLRNLLFLVLVALTALAAAVACVAAMANYDSNISQEKPCPPRQDFQLARHLAGTNGSNLRERFPHQIYLDSADWCSPTGILQDLQALDAINPDSTHLNRELLTQSLTTELEKQWAPKFASFQPDTLIHVLHWAARFHDYKDVVSKADARVFRIVSRHWLTRASNYLAQISEKKPSFKYNFKFKYLVGVCQSKGCSPPTGNSNIEKTAGYFIEQNYSYLFNRFWNSTGLGFKIVAGSGLMVLLYSFICVFKVHFGKR